MKKHHRVLTSPSTLTPAERLVAAVRQEAGLRGHTAGQTADFLGLDRAHWYRLLSSPADLARCRHSVLLRVSQYLGWTLGDVFVSVGLLGTADLHHRAVLPDVPGLLRELELNPVATFLSTPLQHAAHDHQRLLAVLFELSRAWRLVIESR